VSFILDALKKSENERQREIGPSFADVKSAARGSHLPKLWIAIGLLLLINVVALVVLLARREDSSHAPAVITVAPKVALPESSPRYAALPAPLAAAAPLPPAAAPSTPVADEEARGPAAPEPRLDRPQLSNFTDESGVPTMNDVITQGRATLPDLHLDMHVYAIAPEQRFVTINSHKLREGMQIEAGLRVEHITRDGVVLNYRGLRFLLPRE
jgi:general secretion pathway protein B